jgi:hypothetical protein
LPQSSALEHLGDIRVSTKELAKRWFLENCPECRSNTIRVSKYYPEKDIWFFTFPIEYFDQSKVGNLSVLLQHKDDLSQFNHVEVPFSFFRDNKTKFDIRSFRDKFDLHISAKKRNWLQCERSKGVCFSKFER